MKKEPSFLKQLRLRPRISSSEIIISSLSAIIALALVTWITKQALSGSALPYVLASMGATAVILFAMPDSPVGRPWAVLMGHFVSAIIGISCGKLSDSLVIAIPMTIGLTIFAMHYLRSIHPPGGATAMLTLLGGAEISAIGYQFLITPLAINLLILLLAAYFLKIVRNSRRGLHNKIEIPDAWQERREKRQNPAELKTEDLQAALKSLDRYVDVGTEQLMQIYSLAQQQRQQRMLGSLNCGDIMSSKILTLQYGDSLLDAWQQLSPHDEQALIIVSRARHIEGIVTLSDFIKHAQNFDFSTRQQRIAALIKPSTTLTSDKPETVGQIMTCRPTCIQEDRPAAHAWELFEQHNFHHLPVVDHNNKLVGLISCSMLESPQ